jgi:hypothetical protein
MGQGTMKGEFFMRFAMIALSMAAAPALAEILLSEVSGSWAGTDLVFRAVLTQEGDAARLRIWQGAGGVPEGGAPQLDNEEIALGAFTTLQELRLRETREGTVLSVFTGFADETGSGRETVDIRFLDDQFTVTGYHFELDRDVGAPWICRVDMIAGFKEVDGVGSDFAVPSFDILDAGEWFAGAAFDDGYCPQVE